MEDQLIKDLIQSFLEKIGIPIESIEKVGGVAHPLFNVRTQDSKRIIGPQGDHLRALNFLVRRFAERVPELKESKFLIDVNGYHLVHVRELENKARLLAERVRTFRSSAEMTPMNAYDRMIIHALFSDDPEITTESEGTGPIRHVILKYKT